MSKAPNVRLRGTGHHVPTNRLPDAQLYPNRDYERRLTENGRRIINVDLDAELVAKIDQLRGKVRRGLYMDGLLANAIQHQPEVEPQ